MSEGEESEEGTEDSSTSSDTDIKKVEAESVVMEGKAKLHALARDSQALTVRIDACKEKECRQAL